MTQPESPIAPETHADDAGASEDARQHAGRVRGQRIEITSADLTMYSFITGHRPSTEERERALTWIEGDPRHDAIAAAQRAAQSQTVPASYPMRAWHPTVISLRVREMWFNGVTLKTAKPQISHWLRRLSLAIHEGTKRVTRTRAA